MGSHKVRTDSAPATPTLQQLTAAQRRLNTHQEATRQARQARDTMIAVMREGGVPWSLLSEATGVSHRGLSKQISGR